MIRQAALVLAALFASGCFSTRYLWQAAGGQYEMLHVARPISKVVADPNVPERTRHLLAQVDDIKHWGQERGLEPTKNYQRYADLKRSAAVWVVQACAPLEFKPKRWSFPIVGSVPYLGFFEEAAAKKYAQEVAAKEGLDVNVRGASAYSTLGWFNDPVLSTMIYEGDTALAELANVILHESVHATVYVPSQSSFNESLASFIADGMTVELLTETYGARSVQVHDWEQGQRESEVRVQRLHQTYAQLDALYKSEKPDDEKRAEKKRILEAVQKELRLRRPLNNASLAGYKTYATGEAAFARLREACGSWAKMLDAVRTLRERDFAEPQTENFEETLARLATGCR